jgi:hypothetical protein
VRAVTIEAATMSANRPVLVLASLLPLLGTGALSAQESYEERWIRLADLHAAAIASDAGARYQTEFAAEHAAVAAMVEPRCARTGQRSGMSNFQAIVVLDGEGRVRELLPMPRSSHFRCFEKELLRYRYPAPPASPYYQVVRFNLPTAG